MDYSVIQWTLNTSLAKSSSYPATATSGDDEDDWVLTPPRELHIEQDG